ncbi:GYD domain-containing protein [Deltaproteobacteria bacterium]|nr:GYD domain-containing protein [Deltaproteobacteria bacterium]
MEIFFMFGKYSSEAMKEMSAERTEKSKELVGKFGGEIISMHALLGENDLVFIINFPSIEQAMKASIALNKLTKISFTTVPAVNIEEFDKLIS